MKIRALLDSVDLMKPAHLCIVWLQSSSAQAVSDGLCMLPQGLPGSRPVCMQHSRKGNAGRVLELERLAVVLHRLLRLRGLQRAASQAGKASD